MSAPAYYAIPTMFLSIAQKSPAMPNNILILFQICFKEQAALL